jgi:hypothetical protein
LGTATFFGGGSLYFRYLRVELGKESTPQVAEIAKERELCESKLAKEKELCESKLVKERESNTTRWSNIRVEKVEANWHIDVRIDIGALTGWHARHDGPRIL